MAYKSDVKIRHFNDKKSIRLRNDDTHVTVFECRLHLHMVKGELLSQFALSVFCQPNDQLNNRVWRKNFGKVNLAEGTMSTCGNKTLRFK